VQLDQNSDLLRTQILGDESRRVIDQEWLFVGENGARVWARSIDAPTELSREEARIMDSYLWSVVENWRHTYRLARERIGDADWRSRVTSEASYFFGNPYARGWWRSYSRDNSDLPPDLVEHIDTQLRDEPDFTFDYYSRTAEAVRREVETAP
jgi:hypothetical protein